MPENLINKNQITNNNLNDQAQVLVDETGGEVVRKLIFPTVGEAIKDILGITNGGSPSRLVQELAASREKLAANDENFKIAA